MKPRTRPHARNSAARRPRVGPCLAELDIGSQEHLTHRTVLFPRGGTHGAAQQQHRDDDRGGRDAKNDGQMKDQTKQHRHHRDRQDRENGAGQFSGDAGSAEIRRRAAMEPITMPANASPAATVRCRFTAWMFAITAGD